MSTYLPDNRAETFELCTFMHKLWLESRSRLMTLRDRGDGGSFAADECVADMDELQDTLVDLEEHLNTFH